MRVLRRKLLESTPALLRGYPALMIAGPRQSGKTTLARLISPDLPYVNFESPIERADFDRDPVGFLSRFPGGAILDEIQHVPDALAYLQVRIDEEPAMGGWVLTGSQQVVLSRQSAQSLAGRVAMLELLPFSHGELTEGGVAPTSLTEAVFRGGYPPLYDADRDLAPSLCLCVDGWLQILLVVQGQL